MANRFCVMTLGRTASTSLMYALREYTDIALPSHRFPSCEDEELIHRDVVDDRIRIVNETSQSRVSSEIELVENFFSACNNYEFVGFKSMPQWHFGFHEFVVRDDIQFVGLTRRDLASQVASLQVAHAWKTWRRNGEPHKQKWDFTPEKMHAVDRTIHYVVKASAEIRAIPNAIQLEYERLTQPGFASKQLDQYFGRPVRIDDPKGPTCANQYIENWDLFRRYIEVRIAEMQGQPGVIT